MGNCAGCSNNWCLTGNKSAPVSCTGQAEKELLQDSLLRYTNDDLRIARTAAVVEAAGYGQWPRVREIMEFARRMNYRKIGIAFCVGLRQEAFLFRKVLESNDFEVCSVMCKVGSVQKEEVGVLQEEKLHPEKFEAMCNPISQAALLDAAGSQLSVILGLCVGHDTLFIRHTKAPVTVLAVKDRVLAHNPLGALYANHYYQKKLVGVVKQ